MLSSTLSKDELGETIQALIERRLSLTRQLQAASPPNETGLHDFISLSPRMREFVALARKVVDTPAQRWQASR